MASSSSQRSLDTENDEKNTMSVLIATDNHIGYQEKDPERGGDALVTFEEIMQIAQENKVDFILLGGDLFHENKPSRKVVHNTMTLLRKYCMGDRPCYLEYLSDQSINFACSSFPSVNYEDPNYNISIPVFSIHGNHDDPAGDGHLCTLNLLSVSGLVNYFGQPTNVEDIVINPVLIQKGTTKLALYGLGAMLDERLHRTFVNKKVKMLRPKEDPDSWFNCFVIHQNRAKHGLKNYIPEKFLDEFLDLVIWGHEHECLIDPQWSESEKDFFISQPGSSVATSFSPGEAKTKHVGILKIQGKNFRMDKIPLKTVRQFYMNDVILSETDIEPTDDEAIQEYITEQVEELIQQAEREHSGDRRQPKLPLIRVRVEYSGGFSPFNVKRFGQQFVKRVANIKDILLFSRRKAAIRGKRSEDEKDAGRICPEILDEVRMEDLINEYLNSQENKLQLSLLSEHKMSLALKEFVDKDEKEAITEIVKLQLRDTQKVLSTRNIRDEEIVQEVINESERSRLEDVSMEKQEETRQMLQKNICEAQSKQKARVTVSSDEEDTVNTKQTRGRGRGSRARAGRGSRGRGSRGTTKSRDTTTESSKGSIHGFMKKSKQAVVVIDDYDGSDVSATRNSSGSKSKTYSQTKMDHDNDMDDEDPFAFPAKKQRR